MNTMPDPTCPTCGQECEVAVTDSHLIFVCVPCQMREMAQEREQERIEQQKLAEWNAWARGE
jgi:hypothetical protein